MLPESRTNMGALVGGASVSWLAILLVLAVLVWLRPYRQLLPAPLFDVPANLVWVPEASLTKGGGGGGGGNKSLDPPKMTDAPRVKPEEAETIPVATPEPEVLPEPVQAAQVPAVNVATPFAALGPTSNLDSVSRGSGENGGAGGLRGTGIGQREGPGLGNGPKGVGTGTDDVAGGPGVTNPTLISSARPSYTPEAMLRRKEGVVLVECIVTKTGSAEGCRVIRSLDGNAFGLDDEALKAASQFRFNPGRKDGVPVSVRVRIEIAFNMR